MLSAAGKTRSAYLLKNFQLSMCHLFKTCTALLAESVAHFNALVTAINERKAALAVQIQESVNGIHMLPSTYCVKLLLCCCVIVAVIV